jgi:hypothetical protein
LFTEKKAMTAAEKLRIKGQKYRQKRICMLRDIKMRHGCKVCGYKEHWSALDFHHKNPKTKLFNISENKMTGITKLLTEIQKCDILCCNCHRRQDHGDLQGLSDS